MEELVFELFAGPALGIAAEVAVAIGPTIERAAWSVLVFLLAPWCGVALGYLRDTERHLIVVTAILGALGAAFSHWIYAGSIVDLESLIRSILSGLFYGGVVGLIPWTIISALKYLSRRGAYQPGPF